jgi:hypothetical protein
MARQTCMATASHDRILYPMVFSIADIKFSRGLGLRKRTHDTVQLIYCPFLFIRFYYGISLQRPPAVKNTGEHILLSHKHFLKNWDRKDFYLC